ncbi:hypothetical protein BDV09DRAFT_191097 [Aspergillus tetrazonus]
MSPRRGGGSSSGGLPDSIPDGVFEGGTSSAGNDNDYGSSGSSSSYDPCNHSIAFSVIMAIFLVVYVIIALWHIAFLIKGRKIKGVPILLRFRFGACLFCLILSTSLSVIFTGAHECSSMSLWDFVSGSIAANIFFNISHLFLVFVALFPMSRAVRLARRYLSEVANSSTKHHSNTVAEKICQGILLSCMIALITTYLFIVSINQGDYRTAVYDGFSWEPINGYQETYLAFILLQLLANGISVVISYSRVSKINRMELRAQGPYNRARIAKRPGCLASGIYDISYPACADIEKREHGEPRRCVYLCANYTTGAPPPELSAQTHPQTSVAGAVHPIPVHEVPAYNTYAHPNLIPQERAELEALPRSQSPDQWIFVPNGTFPQDGQLNKT